MRHRPKRTWWRPWRTTCAACGCSWFPCPDSVSEGTPSWAREKTTALPEIRFARVDTPLMTPGGLWRSRRAEQR